MDVHFKEEVLKFLSKAVSQHDCRELEQAYLKTADQRIWDAAKTNRIESIVAHALMDALGPGGVPEHWREAHGVNHGRLSAYLSELDRIAGRLAKKGIALVALKNGGIARGIFPCPGCCPMGDLDVLVDKRRFREAHRILVEEGFRFKFRSPLEKEDLDSAEREGGTEYCKDLSETETLWFELQWRPVAGRWIRPDQEPSSEDLIGRSVSIPGTEVRLLSPVDNLLQVALHTAKHTYVRAPGFRLHLDVDRIVRHGSIDWDLFIERTLALQVKTPVFFSLAFPRVLFQTPIPDRVLSVLAPPRWKEALVSGWLQRAGLFNPDERKFGRLGFILFSSLLYDNIPGLWKGVFPDREWMRRHYGLHSDWSLPFYHLRRIADLVFRRLST